MCQPAWDLTCRVSQDLTDTAGLGHSNPAQKIQYHLRLKLQLEQMRHQCTLLLKDRFRLEQCVRCWLLLTAFGLLVDSCLLTHCQCSQNSAKVEHLALQQTADAARGSS